MRKEYDFSQAIKNPYAKNENSLLLRKREYSSAKIKDRAILIELNDERPRSYLQSIAKPEVV